MCTEELRNASYQLHKDELLLDPALLDAPSTPSADDNGALADVEEDEQKDGEVILSSEVGQHLRVCTS